jgi:pSer/pThr/pTyr-binding forkhead associated (FHA) protein
MLTGSQVPNYTLLFLDATKNKSKGSHETIVVPYIELGRGNKCVIQYGDNYPTVSRRHAIIRFDNNNVVLEHIGSNPTLVNNQEVSGTRILNNGDEIQLSSQGPRLRMNTTPTATSKIGLTDRLSMYARQSLKPYRNAVIVLSLLLFSVIGLGGWQISNLSSENERSQLRLEKQQQELQNTKNELAQLDEKAKTQKKLTEAEKDKRAELDRKVKSLEAKLADVSKPDEPGKINGDKPGSMSSIGALEDYVYYIAAVRMVYKGQTAVLSDPNNPKNPGWSGTGFITSDNRFITARHVVEPWRAINPFECENPMMRMAAYDFEDDVTIHFDAISPSGHSFSFTNKNFTFDESKDSSKEITCVDPESEEEIELTFAQMPNSSVDWAYMNYSGLDGKGLVVNKNLISQINKSDRLYALGYPTGLHLQSNKYDLSIKNGKLDFKIDKLDPTYSECTASQSSLINGVLNVSGNSFVGGNSGGPIFLKKDGKFYTVGIVSAGISNELGVVVPLSNITF